jgi:hypothetical protein
VTCRFGELDFAGVFHTAVQENPLRRRITWVRVGTDRFNAEGPVAVIDDGGNGFTSIPVAPIGLAQPITERMFFAFVARAAVEARTANQAVGLLQRHGKAPRTAGCLILLHVRDLRSPVRFCVRMRHK